MALETVTITISTDDLVPALVDDVVVRVFDSTGTTLITYGTTGSVVPGVVEFTLDGAATPTQYQLRFFLQGASIVSPQAILVYSPAVPANTFAVTATIPTLPIAVDPLMCRVSGTIIAPNGAALPGVDVHFVHQHYPLISNRRIVSGERVSERTNRSGYIELDLIRGGTYIATLEAYEDIPREVTVPDQAGVLLSDLLFPIPIQVVWDVAGPWTLADESQLVLTPEVVLSSGNTIEGTATDDLEYVIDDTAVASLSYTDTHITVNAHAAGSTTLRVSRRDTSVGVLPDPGITGGTVGITVV